MGGGSELVLHRCESSFYFAQKERYILCILDGRAALPGFTGLAAYPLFQRCLVFYLLVSYLQCTATVAVNLCGSHI